MKAHANAIRAIAVIVCGIIFPYFVMILFAKCPGLLMPIVEIIKKHYVVSSLSDRVYFGSILLATVLGMLPVALILASILRRRLGLVASISLSIVAASCLGVVTFIGCVIVYAVAFAGFA